MSAPTPTIAISGDVARRFLLGRQGLWPGRRWRGKAGTLTAVRQLGSVQMDPLTIVARSHDLVLWSRVADYRPEMLRHHLYTDRSLFDYGGVLRIQPIEELPHWRLHMERRREDAKYYTPLVRDHPELFDTVRSVVGREGPLSAWAISKLVEVSAAPRRTTAKTGTGSYRSQSVVNKVAYQLWMTGELMTHLREGFERHFDLAERIAPAALLAASDEATARNFFARKILAQAGLITPGSWRSTMAYALNRKIDRAGATAWIDRLVGDGEAITVAVEGHRGRYLAPRDATAQLQDLAERRVSPQLDRRLEDDAIIGERQGAIALAARPDRAAGTGESVLRFRAHLGDLQAGGEAALGSVHDAVALRRFARRPRRSARGPRDWHPPPQRDLARHARSRRRCRVRDRSLGRYPGPGDLPPCGSDRAPPLRPRDAPKASSLVPPMTA